MFFFPLFALLILFDPLDITGDPLTSSVQAIAICCDAARPMQTLRTETLKATDSRRTRIMGYHGIPSLLFVWNSVDSCVDLECFRWFWTLFGLE